MKISFNREYRCCGCEMLYKESDVKYTYKRSCICNNCYAGFYPYTQEAYYEASEGVEFLAPIFRYTGVYRKIFLNYKFNSNIASGNLLGKAMYDAICNRDAFSGYSYIVPVAASKKRYNDRGYNQSELLAKYVSSAIDLPVLNALKRIKHSVPQSRLSVNMRFKNVKGVFGCDYPFSNENVILFDDIYTTGVTASECARVLHRAGANKVCIIAGAYNAPREGKDRGIHIF